MTDEQQPQADPDAAYEAALTGADGRDEYGLPAKQVTHVEGKSLGAAEQEARAKLAAIEQLKGSTEAEQPAEQQSEQPAPEQPEAPEGLLSPEEIVDRLFGRGPEPMSEAEAAALEQLRAEQQLVSGEATAAAARDSEEYEQAIEELIEASPGIQTDEAIAAMDPVLDRIRDAYGDEIAMHPQVLRMIYESTGGEQRWGDVADANATTEAYTKALGDDGVKRDSFGFPVGDE